MRRWLFVALLALPGMAAAEDEVVLYFLNSPYGLDWKTPGGLARTAAINTVIPTKFSKNHGIGHLHVEVLCGLDQGFPEKYLLTGMTTADNNEEIRLLFQEEVGFGIVVGTMGGRLEQPWEVQVDHAERYRWGGMNYVRFKIAPGHCERMLGFYEAYKGAGLDAIYGGLPHRPRQREGAGCSAFGAAFLEVAGLLDEELDRAWSQTVEFPLDMIGGNGVRVSPFKLFFDFFSSWGDGPAVTFYDPEVMFRWVEQRWEEGGETRGKAKGITLDRTHWPVATDPYFY